MNAAQAELTTLQRQAAAELAKDASVTEAATAAKTAQDKVLAANTALQQQQQAIAAEQNKLAQTQQQQQQRATARPMVKKK
ncbi:MAG: hypothetical protein EB034_25740 [Verrucomicrobia bacterium]|nr:hypothetical protein [Verrucomicrobiota bacterium]